MALLTQRTSTIFVAIGDQTHVYRSVEEIPPALRRKLQEKTRGMNSATILIADKRGREELVRALEERPAGIERHVAEKICAPLVEEPSNPAKRSRLASLRTWLELLLPVAIGASLWFFIESHF